jgi:hypothetical protein
MRSVEIRLVFAGSSIVATTLRVGVTLAGGVATL